MGVDLLTARVSIFSPLTFFINFDVKLRTCVDDELGGMEQQKGGGGPADHSHEGRGGLPGAEVVEVERGRVQPGDDDHAGRGGVVRHGGRVDGVGRRRVHQSGEFARHNAAFHASAGSKWSVDNPI